MSMVLGCALGRVWHGGFSNNSAAFLWNLHTSPRVPTATECRRKCCCLPVGSRVMRLTQTVVFSHGLRGVRALGGHRSRVSVPNDLGAGGTPGNYCDDQSAIRAAELAGFRLTSFPAARHRQCSESLTLGRPWAPHAVPFGPVTARQFSTDSSAGGGPKQPKLPCQ
jgi:hypothetical protein